MKKKKYTLKAVKKTYKKSDAWWTVLLVDPVASRLVLPVANYTNIKPNQISVVSFIIGMIAAYCFYQGNSSALLVGALLYHFSFILDCMDGKIARLKGTGSMFGVLLDISLDHIRVVICAIAITVGQFQQTDQVVYFYLVIVLLVAYFFRHINALHVYKLRREMRKSIGELRKKIRTQVMAKLQKDYGQFSMRQTPISAYKNRNRGQIEAIQTQKKKFQLFQAVVKYLKKKRIRMHLYSGIEFQMFIFVIAPIFGFIYESIVYGAILLFLYEVFIIYKLYLSTKAFDNYRRRLVRQLSLFCK